MQKAAEILGSMKHNGDQATGHTWSTKWVHWLAGGFLAYAGIINGKVVDALFSPSAMQTETIIGAVLAALYLYLWFWVRGLGGGSRLPNDAPRWERQLAKLVYMALYASIAAVLLSGFAMVYLAPTDVIVAAPIHQILHMTSRFAYIRVFHEFASGVLALAFGLHFVGALWHRIVRRDGVMQSISLLKRR